jgi:hypothetical protein
VVRLREGLPVGGHGGGWDGKPKGSSCVACASGQWEGERIPSGMWNFVPMLAGVQSFDSEAATATLCMMRRDSEGCRARRPLQTGREAPHKAVRPKSASGQRLQGSSARLGVRDKSPVDRCCGWEWHRLMPLWRRASSSTAAGVMGSSPLANEVDDVGITDGTSLGASLRCAVHNLPAGEGGTGVCDHRLSGIVCA